MNTKSIKLLSLYKKSLHPLPNIFRFSTASYNISYPEFQKLKNQGITIIDTRPRLEFLQGYIPGSYSVFLSGRFEPWIKKLFDKNDKIALVCKDGEENETLDRLKEIDYLQPVQGLIKYEDWLQQDHHQTKLHQNTVMSEQKFAEMYGEINKYSKDTINILDVREQSEKQDGYIEDAQMISVFELEQKLKENIEIIDKRKTNFVFCKSGMRAVLAQSILTKYGITKHVLVGGMDQLSQTDLPIKYDKQN